jgi:hypothetical protein
MTTIFKNHSTVIFVLLLAMVVLTWLFPSSKFVIEAICLFFSFVIASIVVVARNRHSYEQGKLTHRAFVKSNIFDVLSILLAMVSAGLLSRYIAQIMIASLASALARTGVVIVLSLLAGVGIGLLVKRIKRQILMSSNQ